MFVITGMCVVETFSFYGGRTKGELCEAGEFLFLSTSWVESGL